MFAWCEHGFDGKPVIHILTDEQAALDVARYVYSTPSKVVESTHFIYVKYPNGDYIAEKKPISRS